MDTLALDTIEIDSLIEDIWEQLTSEERQEFLDDMKRVDLEYTLEIKENLIDILL